MAVPDSVIAAVLVAQTPVRAAAAVHPLACAVRRHTHARTQLQGTARRAAAAVAGKRDLATLQPDTQLRSAGAAARRPLRRRPPRTPDRAGAPQQQRGDLADHRRHASRRGLVAGPAGAAVFRDTRAIADRAELARTARPGRRSALAGAPDQPALCAGTGGVGTHLRGQRIQPLPESPHDTRGLGHRTRLSPASDPLDAHAGAAAARPRPAVRAATGGAFGGGAHASHHRGKAGSPAPAQPVADQPGGQPAHQRYPRPAAIPALGNGDPLALWRRSVGQRARLVRTYARAPATGRGAATQSGRLDDGHRSVALGGAVHRRCRGALAPSRVAAALCRALRPTITQTPGPTRNTLRPVGEARQPACGCRR